MKVIFQQLSVIVNAVRARPLPGSHRLAEMAHPKDAIHTRPGGVVYTITYSSFATIEFCDADLGNLLMDARERNERLDITGALLYRNGRFVQVLEGAEEAVRECFATIVADTRHTIHMVSERPITVRRFDTWTMGYQRDGSTFNLKIADYDHPYHSLPSALSGSGREAQEVFDWLYNSWLMFTPGSRPIPNDFRPDTLQSSEKVAPHVGKPHIGGSTVVTSIFDQIMDEVHSGSLRPGDRVNDTKLAKRFGTSRTPVREALQKLRDIGVVEVAANRFTRIAIVDQTEAAEQFTVWAALYSALLDEVIGKLSASVIDGMHEDRIAVLYAIEVGDVLLIAMATVDFFLRLVAESQNSVLRKNLYAVAHVIKLAEANFGELVTSTVLTTAFDEFIAGAMTGNTVRAKQAIELLARQY